MSIKKVRILYIAFQTFFSLFLWLPIFYEYQRQIGLTDGEIVHIQSLYYLAFCFLEIPTGWLADRWGYRRTLLGGSAIITVANFIPVWSHSVVGMIGHFILIATARSLISGTASAYLFEKLKEHDKSDSYKQIEGQGRAFNLLGKVLCWPFVGLLMNAQIDLPYLLSAVFSLLSLGTVVALPKIQIQSSPTQKMKTMTNQLRSVWRCFLQSPTLCLLVVQGIAIFVMGRVQITFFQPLLKQAGWDVITFGGVMAVMSLFEALGAFMPKWLKTGTPQDVNRLFALTLIMAFSLFWVGWAGPWGAIAGFCVFCFSVGVLQPIQRQLIQQAILDSRVRATILSIESLADRLGSALVIAWMGAYVAQGRLGDFLGGLALSVAVIMLVLYVFLRRLSLRYPTPQTGHY